MKDSKSKTQGKFEKIKPKTNFKERQNEINNNQKKNPIISISTKQNIKQEKKANDNSKNLTNKNFNLEKKKNQMNEIFKTEPNKINQDKREIKSANPQKVSQNLQNEKPQIKSQSQVNSTPVQKMPKYEFDNKIIKSFMPYYEKNMTYTKKLAKNEEKIIFLYDKKIDELINIYIFTEKYLLFITQTFKKICHPFYYILSMIYLKDIKPYFAYFKNLVSIFETFSENLKKLGHSIQHSSTEDEYSNMSELMNVEFDLNKSVEKLNLIYADIFSIITNNLKENVLNKPLCEKLAQVEPKFLENEKNMEKMISKLEHRREKLLNKYKKEYEQMFCYYKEKKQNQSQELFNDLVCMKDFLFIEYDLISYCNKAYIKIRQFLKDIEVLFNNSTNLFCDYLEALKTMIKIYYDENRFIINPNILTSSMISNLDKLIHQDIRKNIEKKLSIKNIIEFSKDFNLRNEMNHLLLNYRDILIQSQILKEKNDLISEITNFNLHNFKKTQHFFSFLQDLVPKNVKFNFENFIQMKLTIKIDGGGIIKKWKNTLLTVTYQGHILFLEEDIPNSNQEQSNKINKNEKNENQINFEDANEEEKNKDKIIKDSLSKGIIPNKLLYMFLKTSYGIFGTGKKDDKYLFQIWSYYNGNKKYKQLNVDALTQDNLTQILNVLNDNNDMNLTKIND